MEIASRDGRIAPRDFAELEKFLLLSSQSQTPWVPGMRQEDYEVLDKTRLDPLRRMAVLFVSALNAVDRSADAERIRAYALRLDPSPEMMNALTDAAAGK